MFLSTKDIEEIKVFEKGIEQIIVFDKVPDVINSKICIRCSYYDFCYVNEL